MKKILLLLTFLLSGIAFSQTYFKGKILDEATQKPLTNAIVYLPELNKTVKTDSKGVFSAESNNKQYTNAEIISDGYKTKTFRLDAGKNVVILLSEKITEIEEIVMTGNGSQSREKLPFAIETITTKELLKSGKISLSENLSSIPGISFTNMGTAVTKPVIRGLNNTNLVFLNNGFKAENFQFSNSHPFLSDEFNTRKIEVIKGPFSLIYGSDAVGGVINVIRENPAPENTFQSVVNSQYHSNSEGFVNHLGIKTSGKIWFGGFSFSNKTHKDYRDGNDVQIFNSRFLETNFGTNLGFRNRVGNFTVSYDYTQPKYGLINKSSSVIVKDNHRKVEYWYQLLENHLLTSKNKIFIGKNTLEVDFGYQQNKREGVSDPSNTNPEMKFSSMDLKTISYNTKYNFGNEKNKTIVGFNGAFLQNDADDFYKNSNPMPDAKINDLGFFVVNDYQISESFNLNAGLRYDFRTMKSYPFQSSGLNKYTIDNEYSSLSGSLGSTYKINNHLFKLNIASGFRSPNISELTQNGIHSNRFERGDVNLKAQRNYQVDFNYHFHISNLVLDVSPFYNTINNFIYIVQTNIAAPVGGGKIWQYVQNNALLYGAEISADYHPFSWLGLHSNYTYTKGELKKGGYLTQIPQNRWVAELKFEKEKISFLNRPFLIINYSNFFAQNNLGQNETYTPNYQLFNLNIGSELQVGKQKINWYIAANNLFDEVYIDHLSSLKPLNNNNIGRNVVFGLTIPISFDLNN